MSVLSAVDSDANQSQEHSLDQLRQAFAQFDLDGSGTIDKTELKAVLKALGHPVTPVELDDLLKRMDTDGSGTIDFQEFATVLANRHEEEEAEGEIEDMMNVFMSFDADGSGNLSRDELQRALKILGVQLSAEEVALLTTEIDQNNDGEVSYEEFMSYLMQFEVEEGEGEQGHSGSH
eukprot:scaffold12.g8156.t1